MSTITDSKTNDTIVSDDNETSSCKCLLKAYGNNTKLLLLKDNKIIKEMDYTEIQNTHIDELTFLRNRRALKELLCEIKEERTLLYVDLKDFGTMNEAYGEDIANIILKEFAYHLSNSFRDFETFRIEADIFALLSNTKNNLTSIDMKHLLEIFFSHPLEIGNEKIVLCATIAFTKSKKDLIKKAETTLKEAKKESKGFLVYSDVLGKQRQEKHEEHKNLSQKILQAINNKKIFPVFQPIQNNHSKQIDKYESLARLEINKNEILTPDMFIPFTKRINKYNEVTAMMIEKTLDIFNGKDVGVSLNMSIEDISNEDMVDFIVSQLKKFKEPKNITFEILEDSSVAFLEITKEDSTSQRTRIVKKFFNEIRSFGCSIAIDDFGSGYSNFINILAIKPDLIKIDGTIIKSLSNKKVKLMTEMFIAYARSINCEVVAEYVENQDVQNLIESMGIKYSQGYYIGKPSKIIKH